MKKLSYSHKIEVCFDEADFLNRLKPSSYMQYFQDITSKHYSKLGLDSVSMAKKNMFWILSRMSVEIVNQINLNKNKKLTISTCMRKTGLAESTRDYYILQNNKVMVKAVSRWCVLNINTRKICPISDFLPFKDSQYENNPAISPQLIKSAPMRINQQDTINFSQEFNVKNSDLDANFHMNNARYGDLIFNACDFELLNTKTIKSFDIHFKSELKPNQNFTIIRADFKDYSLFNGINFQQNQIYFNARIEWDI